MPRDGFQRTKWPSVTPELPFVQGEVKLMMPSSASKNSQDKTKGKWDTGLKVPRGHLG